MLTCVDTTKDFTDAQEGALPLPRAVAYRVHLAACWHCRTYVRQMKATMSALATLPAPAPPRASLEKALAAMDERP